MMMSILRIFNNKESKDVECEMLASLSKLFYQSKMKKRSLLMRNEELHHKEYSSLSRAIQLKPTHLIK